MIRHLMYICLCLLAIPTLAQDNLIKLRYWNGTTDGKGITSQMGLTVSANRVSLANALVKVDEATLSGAAPKFYFKKKFVLFFTVENTGSNDVAIYDWAFKAVCPVDNMGRKFDATSMVPLVTPYIPRDIYIILKPGEKKRFYSAETDFYWCLPNDKNDLLHDPQFFQALITCAAITGSPVAAKPGQQPGGFQPASNPPQNPEGDLDDQLAKLISEHNGLIQKKENDRAESLRKQILDITRIAYPQKLSQVESKLMKPAPVAEPSTPNTPSEKSLLSFNGQSMDAEGDCMDGVASLGSTDETNLLTITNLRGNGTFSVNANFYTNACTDCLAVQLVNTSNSKIYIAVSGTINKTAKGINVDVTMKEMTALVEGGGSSYRVTGRIVCDSE